MTPYADTLFELSLPDPGLVFFRQIEVMGMCFSTSDKGGGKEWIQI